MSEREQIAADRRRVDATSFRTLSVLAAGSRHRCRIFPPEVPDLPEIDNFRMR